MRRKNSLLLGVQIGAVTMENSMEAPQKLKIGLQYDPEIPSVAIYPKK